MMTQTKKTPTETNEPDYYRTQLGKETPDTLEKRFPPQSQQNTPQNGYSERKKNKARYLELITTLDLQLGMLTNYPDTLSTLKEINTHVAQHPLIRIPATKEEFIALTHRMDLYIDAMSLPQPHRIFQIHDTVITNKVRRIYQTIDQDNNHFFEYFIPCHTQGTITKIGNDISVKFNTPLEKTEKTHNKFTGSTVTIHAETETLKEPVNYSPKILLYIPITYQEIAQFQKEKKEFMRPVTTLTSATKRNRESVLDPNKFEKNNE